MIEPFGNSGDHDRTLRSVAFDLDLHCLPITLLEVSRLQWVNCLMSGKQLRPYQTSQSAASDPGSDWIAQMRIILKQLQFRFPREWINFRGDNCVKLARSSF